MISTVATLNPMALLNAGFSVIPIRKGTKAPAVDWMRYQEEPPSAEEVDSWQAQGYDAHGIICGEVSGGLEVIDIDDNAQLGGYWTGEAMHRRFSIEAGYILTEYDIPLVKTPGDGYQYLYRRASGTAPGNQRLAHAPDPDPKNKAGRLTAIETRGEGGQVLCVGSKHPDGGIYEIVNGDILNIPVIPDEKAEKLLAIARELCEAPHTKNELRSLSGQMSSTRNDNGDDGAVWKRFNDEHPIKDLLKTYHYTNGSKPNRLSRPGQPESMGVSIFEADNVAYIHSSNDPLYDLGKDGYVDPAEVIIQLEYNGDRAAAYRAIGQQQYMADNPGAVLDNGAGQAKSSEVVPVHEAEPEDEQRKPSKAKILFDMASDRCELSIGENDGETYATLTEDGKQKCLRLRSNAFNGWAAREYMSFSDGILGGSAVSDAKAALTALAREKRPVYMRTGKLGNKVYIDLGDDTWNVIEVDADGWRTIERSPIAFYRPVQTEALPRPERGGSIDDLFGFLNVDDRSARLLSALLPYCLQPDGPFPILLVTGEAGSGKSTAMRIIQRLIDPRKGTLRGIATEPKATVTYANSTWLMSYENVSNLTADVSDALCMLSTGGSYGARQLYSDLEEVTFEGTRPVMLNGITDFANRPDLLSRAVAVHLQPIAGSGRIRESDFWRRFNRAHSKVLGAILDILSVALRQLPETELDEMPRMADFATFGVAAQSALPQARRGFLDELFDNQRSVNQATADSEPLTEWLTDFLSDLPTGDTWKGKPSALLKAMTEERARANEGVPDDYPKTAVWLGRKMRELAPAWRAAGIIEFKEGYRSVSVSLPTTAQSK